MGLKISNNDQLLKQTKNSFEVVRRYFLVSTHRSEEGFSTRGQFCLKKEKKAEPSYYMIEGIFKVEAKNGLKSLHAVLEVCSGSLITHSSGKESRELITRTQPQLEPPHWHKVNPHDAAGSAFKEMINSSSKGMAFVLLNSGVEIRKVFFSFKTFRATSNWPLCCSPSAKICVIEREQFSSAYLPPQCLA